MNPRLIYIPFMSRHTAPSFGLMICLALPGAASAAVARDPALWDMTDVRRQALEPERLGEPRIEPFAAPGASEWMNTVDDFRCARQRFAAVRRRHHFLNTPPMGPTLCTFFPVVNRP